MSQENNREIKNTESHNNQTNERQINDELGFNVRAISNASENFIEQLSKAQNSIQAILNTMQETVSKQEKAVDKIDTESGILCLIPSKVQNTLNSIAPKIASEVDRIYNSDLKDTNRKIDLLQDKLNNEFNNYRQKLDETTHKCIAQLLNATEGFNLNMEQKLKQFTDELSASAGLAAAKASNGFLKNLSLVVLFSAIVASITCYITITKFPRFVTVNDPNSLSIYDSKVQVWNSKTLDIKERLTGRK